MKRRLYFICICSLTLADVSNQFFKSVQHNFQSEMNVTKSKICFPFSQTFPQLGQFFFSCTVEEVTEKIFGPYHFIKCGQMRGEKF